MEIKNRAQYYAWCETMKLMDEIQRDSYLVCMREFGYCLPHVMSLHKLIEELRSLGDVRPSRERTRVIRRIKAEIVHESSLARLEIEQMLGTGAE